MAIRKNAPKKSTTSGSAVPRAKKDGSTEGEKRREAARKFAHEFGKKHSRAMKKLAE